MSCKTALAALCLAATSCSHSISTPALQRIAILRFENLGADPTLDWMGRAFSEIVSRELAAVPGIYALSLSQLHNLDPAAARPAGTAPGISSERTLALATGASRLGYGEFWLRNGRLEARITMDDVTSGKTQVMASSAADVASAATALARQISPGASSYGTLNSPAIKAYVLGLDATDPAAATARFQDAIAADPDFEPPYAGLAAWKIQQRDRAGALAVLDQAMAHRGRMPELERAQLSFDAANMHGDLAGRKQALATLVRVTPNDPFVWRSVADSAATRHDFAHAVEAYQKVLSLQPNDVASLNQLGYEAAYNGDLPAATLALQQSQALRPGDPNPLDSLGDVNLLVGRFREAENYYLEAVKKNPAFLAGADLRKAAMARLFTGDVSGADALAGRYLDGRALARDPLADYYRAEWLWTTGHRKEALPKLEDFARRSENGLKDAAAEAYGELAVWNVALGNRSAAAQMAQKAASQAGAASAVTVAVARFLAQPPASAGEWAARADRAFPQAEARPLKDRALVYALLADRQFLAAREILKRLYEESGAVAEDDIPLLLAWCNLETGQPREAAGLLRFNPLPPTAGVRPFQTFSFPRLFYLRGRLAMLDAAGQSEAARAQFRLFLQLSGDAPLLWGEEAQARSVGQVSSLPSRP